MRAKIACSDTPPLDATGAELKGAGDTTDETLDRLIVELTVPHQGPKLCEFLS